MSFDLLIKDGDLAIGSNGDLDQVTDINKLVQDVLKILVTPAGANKFFPWYGTLMRSIMVGQPNIDTFEVSMTKTQIQNAMAYITNMQLEQSKWQSQTAGELLAALKDVYIEKNLINPTQFAIA